MHKNSFFKRWIYTFFALFIWMGVAHAQMDENIHIKTVTLGFQQEKLFNALLAVEEASGFRMVFPGEPVNAAHLVDLSREERTVAVTLQLILKGTNLSFKQTGNTIVLFLADAKEAAPASAQWRAAAGTWSATARAT